MDVLAREFRAEAARTVASTGLGDPKISYTIPEFCSATGIGRTRIYAALATGQLRARKFGKRTIILAEDGRAFLVSLPELRAA
jgi:hypothetical protein